MCGCVEKMRYSADTTFDEVKGLLTTDPSTPVKEGTGKEGTGKEGTGKEGTGKEGTGKEGTGKEGSCVSPVSRAIPRPFIVAAVVVPGLVALGVCAYQLSLPNVLFGYHYSTGNPYDDGVYLGAALHLVNGVLPYRDFVLLHPPGVALLMTPIAALGRIIGTRDAMAGARLVTVLITALNAGLAAIAASQPGCRGHDHWQAQL